MSRILLTYFFPLLLMPDVAGAKTLQPTKPKAKTPKAAAVSVAEKAPVSNPYAENLAAQAQIRLISIAQRR